MISDILAATRPFLEWLVRASWQAALLALLVLLVQWAGRSRISPRWRYGLWLAVLLRLVLPAGFQTRLSPYRLLSNRLSGQDTAAVIAPLPAANQVSSAGGLPRERAAEPHAPASAINSPARSPLALWEWLAIAWAAGVVIVSGRVLWASVKLARIVRRLAPITDGRVVALLGECAAEFRLKRVPGALEAPAGWGPALVGLIRPRLLLPADALSGFGRRELRLILLHELAHMRRHDAAVGWLMTVLLILHWFNPILWLAFARMRADRELACDELVMLRTNGDERRAYGPTIVQLLETLSRPRALPGSIGVLEMTSHIERRITMIASFDRRRHWPVMAAVAALALIAVAVTDGVRAEGNKNEPAPRASAAPEAATNIATAKIQAKLAQKLPKLSLQNVTLRDALDSLHKYMDVNMVVDWKAIEAAGVAPDTQVTLELKDVTIQQALKLVARAAAGDTLGYGIEDGVLVVSTSDAVSAITEVEVYDVRDLVGSGDNAEKKVEALANLLRAMINPERWAENGGKDSIVAFNGKLTISTAATAHLEIQKLLAKLRDEPAATGR